jgi:hypothetical protein
MREVSPRRPVVLALAGCAAFVGGSRVVAETKQFVDVPPSGSQEVRAMEGGGSLVAIDTTTPLSELIKRLEGDWQEVETGKAYWIGYPDDMYSIAAHGDEAIAPLLALSRSTKSEHTKLGVALTLHLIGIDRRIAGRFIEDFRNPKARQALLSLLTDRQVQEPVLRLLVRNPWPSDLPELFRQLATASPHAWAFVKALDRYGIRGAPVHQTLPKPVARRECGAQFDGDDKFVPVIHALTRSLGRNFTVDSDVQPRPPDPRIHGPGMIGGGVGMVLEAFTGSTYTDLGDRFEYYLDGDTVHLCSVATARARWLAWYGEHRDADIKADGPRAPW